MRAARLALYGLGGLLALLLALFVALQTGPVQRLAARLVSGAASGPEGGLEIRGLAGFFPTDLTVGHIAYADRQGAWLTVDDARLSWSILPLLRGQLRIDALAARRVSVLRSPLPSTSTAGASGGGGGLPVGVEVRSLDVADLHLGKDLLGADSHWALSGAALVPATPAEGNLRLAGKRTDGPAGSLAVDMRFDLQRQWIDGEATFNEGPNGIVAVLLERRDLAGFGLDFQAKGDARTGTARIKVSADDAVTANGTLDWQPRDDATAATLRFEGAGPGLPAGPLADALRQPVRLEADAVLDERRVELSKATLTSGPQRVDVSGSYDRASDRVAGGMIVQSPEPAALAGLAAGMAWRGLRLDLKADVAEVTRTPRGAVDLIGRVEDVTATAVDPRLPKPGALDLKARASLADGRIDVTGLDLRSGLAAMTGGGSYAMPTDTGEGRLRLDVFDLAAFSDLAGRRLAGTAALDVTASRTPQGARLSWQGSIDRVEVAGVPAQALRDGIALSGNAALQPDGGWRLGEARIGSAAGQLAAAGQGRGDNASIDLALDLSQLAALEPSLAGAGRVTGRVVRADGRTEAKIEGSMTGLARGPLTSRTLSLSAAGAIDAAGAASGTLSLQGDLAEQAVSLDGRFAVDAAGGLRVPTFQGRWASAVLDVSDFAIAGGAATGQARLRVARLEDAAVLAGTPLAGAIDLEIAADPAAAGQVLTVRGDATGLRAGTIALSGLELRARVERPGPDLALDATLAADGLSGVADLSGVKATAKGGLKDMAVAVQANGRETRASLEASLQKAGEDLAIALRRLDGSYRAIPVALAAPGRIVVAGPRVTIEPLALRLGSGRVSARGTIAPEGNDLQVEVAALPLQLVDAFAPGTGLDGALQARAQVRGTAQAPAVEASYSIAALRLRRPEMALLPPVALQGTATLAGPEASAQARVTAGGGTALALKGRATLPRGGAPLAASAAVSGNVELAPFSPLLGNTVRNVSGRLRPDLAVEINGAQVTGSGSIDFSNGALALPESGMRLSNGQGRLVLQGNTLQVQRLAFQTAGNGTLAIGGSVGIDPGGGVRPDLSITSQGALLVNRPDLVARVSANLKVTGDTTTALDIGGSIRIDRAEVSIGGQQAAAFPTIEVREVDKPGVSPAQLMALQPPPKSLAPAAAAGPPIRLNMTIDAPQAVFVRGRGLDAEMGGQLTVGGTPAAPAVTGGLTIRRGEFNLLGHRLTFSKGVVTLDNLDRVDPRLDFVANTTINQTVITVTIAGTARAPSIAVSSSPAMPPDEAMAMLLFGKPASGLSVFELAQAAQGLAELTGQASGAGAIGRLRGGLGLDRLSVDSGKSATAPVSVEAGRYVAPGVYVGARQGATGNSSRGVVQVEVLDHVKIEGDIGADSTGRVGVKTEWDY